MNIKASKKAERHGGDTVANRYLLLLGIAVTALSGSRFNIASLGWVASTPWLLFVRRMQWRRGDVAAFLAAVQAGVLLNTAKIVTPPMPWFFAPFISVQPALMSSAAYLTFEAVRRALGDRWGLLTFPSLVVAVEWIGGTVLEMSSWGCLAYTQLEDLALLQVVSLLGLGGVSFLLASSSSAVAVLLDGSDAQRLSLLPVAWAVAGLVVVAQGWGAWRIGQSLEPGPMVTVATIGSDLELPTQELPSRSEVSHVENVLFQRTLRAAEAGAEVIVWNEVATVALTREDEAALSERGEALARELGVDIVIGYGVPLEDMRLFDSFENKYLWVGPEGKVASYNKHHPVPGLEGAVPGEEPLVVHNRPYGRAAGAICYDYDFPEMGMAHARGGAGIVVVPSSDWRGIDQFHTKMSSVRGIEGGFSVVRSVHSATSGAYDALGRTLATLSWQDDERIMIARVPVTPITTLYSRIGDVFPQACSILVVATIGVTLLRGYQGKGAAQKTPTVLKREKAAKAA